MGFFDVLHAPPVVFGSGEEYPWPTRFSIETSSYCNRRCSFCPISGFGGEIPRPRQQLMTQELFDSVVAQLAERRFDGVIQLFLLNEPTLDKRLPELASQLRDACRACTIYVSTNGDTSIKYHRDLRDGEYCSREQHVESCDALTDLFDSGINVININVYDTGVAGSRQAFVFNSVAQMGVEHDLWQMTQNKYRRHRSNGRYLCVSDMRTDREDAPVFDMFHSKGHSTKSISAYCARPMRHLVIQWDGRVPLCCAMDQTAPDAVFVGDLNKQSITEVWNSEVMFKYRSHLQEKRRDLPGCVGCDHKMSYPHVVRKVSLPVE